MMKLRKVIKELIKEEIKNLNELAYPSRIKKWANITHRHFQQSSARKFQKVYWNQELGLALMIDDEGKFIFSTGHPLTATGHRSVQYIKQGQFKKLLSDPIKAFAKIIGKKKTMQWIKKRELDKEWPKVDWEGIIDTTRGVKP